MEAKTLMWGYNAFMQEREYVFNFNIEEDKEDGSTAPITSYFLEETCSLS